MAIRTNGTLLEELILDQNDPTAVEDWLERLEQSMEIAIFNSSANLPEENGPRNARINEIRRSYLLSCLGRQAYKLLKSYCVPDAPTAKTYEQLKTILIDKLVPRKNRVTEQYKFNSIRQEVNENLAMFMARIKSAAASCAFGDQFTTMVRNRFICGLRSEKIRASLLSECEDDTTLDRIFNKASAKMQAMQSNTENYIRTIKELSMFR